MAEGWIKLYRNIQDHWIWQDPVKLKWWLDILLLVNHKENKFMLGQEVLKVERGEHHTSEEKLSTRWGVSRGTVRRFLKLLESENMIELKKSKKGTTLKVSNYNEYQDFSEGKKTTNSTTNEPPVVQQTDNKRTTNDTTDEPLIVQQTDDQRYTNNNEKKENNEKNEKEGKEREEISTPLPPPSSPSKELLSKYLTPVTFNTFFKNADIEEENGVIKIKPENEFSKGAIKKYIETLELETNKKIEVI